MKLLHYFCTLVFKIGGCGCSRNQASEKKPNGLLVIGDDLGWIDIGCYGSEIDTANLDQLAKCAVISTNFHSSMSCSPTRAMMLSGTDNHIAGLGNRGELLTPEQKGKLGYEGYLNNWVISFAEVLKGAGHKTYMAGKWCLGHEAEIYPSARSFYRQIFTPSFKNPRQL